MKRFILLTFVVCLGCEGEASLTMDGQVVTDNSANNENNTAENNLDNNAQNNANNLLSDMGNGAADLATAEDMAPDEGPTGPVTDGPLGEWCTGQPQEFSFFVTSMAAIWTLAGSPLDDLDGGMGGDFGGLQGADAICETIAAATGFQNKTWRAFLSVTDDGNGNPVHAIDRIGTGPWYDSNGRLVAMDIAGLLVADRPDGDAQTRIDLPDECGVPLTQLGDAHDIVTGSDVDGRLNNMNPESTCMDWTSSDGNIGSSGGATSVMCGHSFPRNADTGNGANWRSDHPVRGCGRGANLIQNGAGTGTCIGCSGGYGAIYCFAQ